LQTRILALAKITRVDFLMVDLQAKVKRVDAIQSFTSQETPIIRITDSDGASGTGYCYTIGTGGPSVMAMIERTFAPALIGRDANEIEGIWRSLFLMTHATTVGPITSAALAAIDTALWDLRCHKVGLPLHILAGGAQKSVPVYSTEGGWLNVETTKLVEDASTAKARGFSGVKIKVGHPAHIDVARIAAVRDAVGAGFEIFTDANQSFHVDEAVRRAKLYEPLDIGWLEEPLPADDVGGHVRLAYGTSIPIAVGESMYSIGQFRDYLQRHHAVAESGAHGGMF
jgi:L-alanine-DL-glutamate epimerase-like enolase superfamily enzyme